jgi:hypothetical protein
VHSLLRKSKINMNHVEQTDFVMLPFPSMQVDAEGKYAGSSKYVLSFIAQRAWHRYVYNHICTTLCLQLLGWCVLLFKTSGDGDDRLELLFALLLTTVASKFAVSDDLPKLPFLTALDNYVLVSFIFLTLMAIEAAIVGALTCPEEKRHEIPIPFGDFSADAAHTIDIVAQGVLLFAWLVFNVHECYVGLTSVWRMATERRENMDATHETWKAIERDSERRKSVVKIPRHEKASLLKKSMSIKLTRKSLKSFRITRSQTTKDTSKAKVNPEGRSIIPSETQQGHASETQQGHAYITPAAAAAGAAGAGGGGGSGGGGGGSGGGGGGGGGGNGLSGSGECGGGGPSSSQNRAAPFTKNITKNSPLASIAPGT